MAKNDIPLDKAELLSVLLEALLYGFSLLMFGGTIWTLLFRRSADRVNRKMLTVACALLLCSTLHIVGHIIRVMDGLILYRDTFQGGPAMYFADISLWTFNFKNYVYIVQMLIGDGVILYRCYVVWQSKLIMILPILLWCAAGLTGFMSCYNSQITKQSGVFGGAVSRWITSFWATSFTANLLTTLLLVFRLWYIDRKAARLRGRQQSPVRPILYTIIDAGAIYSLTLLAALLCFVNESNAQYVVLDMVTPIISITFYMVIIRVGLAARASCLASVPFGDSADHTKSADRRRKMNVHIMTLTESKVDYDQRRLTTPTHSPPKNSSPSDIEVMLDDRRGEESLVQGFV